jgi:hypothetical protein
MLSDAVVVGEPDRFGMTGHQRAILYRVAVETGLRAEWVDSRVQPYRSGGLSGPVGPCLLGKIPDGVARTYRGGIP